MSDAEDDGFNENTFKDLNDTAAPATIPPAAASPTPAAVDPPKDPTGTEPKPKDPEKKEEPVKPVEEPTPAPATDEKKPEETPKPPETPEEKPPVVETPQPLTKDDVKSVVSDLLNTERSSSKELESMTQEVLEKYYPDGSLSNVLVDQKSGKELRTPADVVEASGDQMSTEEAAQWLMNEQYKLDKEVDRIKNDAKKIAETTLNFKRDAVAAVQKYEPLFKAYPALQQKVYDKLMKQVKVDKDKEVILSAPDVIEHYDDYLEPYQQAFEFANKQPATNPVPSTTPEPPKPTVDDRLDEPGDGGVSVPDDPDNFAQQVTKELS